MKQNTNQGNTPKNIIHKANKINAHKRIKQTRELKAYPYQVNILDEQLIFNSKMKKGLSMKKPLINKTPSIRTVKSLKVQHSKDFTGFTHTINDLILLIAEQEKMTNQEAKNIIEAIFNNIEKALINVEDVSISSFGKFNVKQSKSRIGLNPATGQKIQIAATNQVKFHPAKTLKELVDANHQKSTIILEEKIMESINLKPQKESIIIEEAIKEPIVSNQQKDSILVQETIKEPIKENHHKTPIFVKDTTHELIEKTLNKIKESLTEYETQTIKLTNDEPTEDITKKLQDLSSALENNEDKKVENNEAKNLAFVAEHFTQDPIQKIEHKFVHKIEQSDHECHCTQNLNIVTTSESILNIHEPQLDLANFQNENKEHLNFAKHLYKEKSKWGSKQSHQNSVLILSAAILLFSILTPFIIKLTNFVIYKEDWTTLNFLVGPHGNPISLDPHYLNGGTIVDYMDYIANVFLIVNIPVFSIIFIIYLVYYLVQFTSSSVKRAELMNYKTKQTIKEIEISTTSNSKVEDLEQEAELTT